MPDSIRSSERPVFEFNRCIVDSTYDLVSCYKPQIAHYAALGAEDQLKDSIDYIHGKGVPVLLDAKRGDVGSTAERYAEEAFGRYGADAVTINPYLGLDAMEPFLDYKDKGIVILCRTSNPGGADIQNLAFKDGRLLYEHVAQQARDHWNYNNNVLLVVGATQPDELARIREITGDMTFLVPGVGTQAGDVEALMRAGEGGSMIISSSRAILYASEGDDFADAARKAAENTRDEINQYR